MSESETHPTFDEKNDSSDNADEASDGGGSLIHQDVSTLSTYPLLSSLRLPESLKRISPSPSDDTSQSTSVASPADGATSRLTSSAQYREAQERRSSARSVKRKKYDDEIVESSLRPAYYK